MLKRFVARLLIVLQIYGNLFQGVAHAADLADSYPIRNEIHLHSSVDKHGSLRLALGTDGIEDSTELKWFDIPSYQTAKKLAPQIGLSQITEVEVDDENLSNYSDDNAYLSTDDESSFEREGITRNSQAAAFTLQGLKFSISNNGTMVIEGRQTGNHKPIFLNNEAPIILDGVTALALKITAPRVVNTGTSRFKQLIVKGNYIEGEDEDRSKTSFINHGNLTAKELFLSSCNSVNHQTITAARFEINGELTSDGSLTSDELILEESAYLHLNEDSRADIKTLFLSKASHFENQQQAEAVLNIGVLYGSDGSLTNLGTMAIDKMEVDSAFQSITNRHFLDIALGSIKAQQFENHGTFTAEQSDLQVGDGQNFGALKAKSLQVKTAFTNTLSGVMDTSQISGSGHLRNLGGIETQGDLELGIKQFSNSGQTVGKSIDGSSTLEQFDNTEDGIIEATRGLSFTEVTQVNNLGVLRGEDMALYSDKTLQKGELTARALNLIGRAFLNQGEIEVDDFTAETGLINEETLTTFRSTAFGAGGLTNTAKAKAYLKGLGLSCDTRVINHGKLVVEGVDTALGILQITNSGVASIDNAQVLPKASEQSPENLARIATTVGPVTWENYLYSSLRTDHEFENQNGTQAKISASKYLRLLNALSQNQPYVYDYAHKIDPAVANLNGLILKQRGSSHKKAFIERYEKDVVRSTTEGSLEERAELQQYLKQFESHYSQIFTARNCYAKSLHPTIGTALVVESSSIPAVKLQLLNQTPGALTLKSGKFEFVGNQALVNDGTLIQDSAYTLWLTNVPGEFNRGTWKATGSLGLLGYVDAKFADLEVSESLFIDTKADAFKALASLANVKTSKVSISAPGALGLNSEFAELYPTLPQKEYETEHFKRDVLPKLYTKFGYPYCESYEKYIQSYARAYPLGIAIRDACAQAGHVFETDMQSIKVGQGIPFTMYSETERRAVLTDLAETFKLTYPWPLEISLSGGFTNAFNVSAPELKVKAQSLKTSGNLFSTQALLELLVAESAEISASIGGQAGINLWAKKLKVLGRADIPGAVRPNVFYKRNDNGLYAQGPVVLNIAELLDNQYGVIQGSSYTINAPQLINLAGLITATDPSLSSTIAVKEIKNLRDEARGYTTYSRQQRIYYSGGKDWCGCCGTRVHRCRNNAWMDIPIANSYETSDEGVIFAQGDLTLNYHQLEMLVSRITSGGKLTLISGDKQFTYENAPDIKVLPGTTTMTVRNLHGNHVVAKQDLHVELGNANMATSMQGQNIFVNAGMLTLQNLGLQNKSQGKIVNLLSLMQGGVKGDGHTSSNSNIFKTIGSGDGSDYTDLTLPFKHQSLPTSLVILGQDARSQLTQNQGIDLQATMRSLEQAMGSQIYTLYRGINGLGLNIHDFFKATSDFVRGHKDTITQRRSIKSGETTQEVDVQLNPTLTQEDLQKSGFLGFFLDFTKNIQGSESTHKALDDVNQTKQKCALMFAVPADHKKNPGIHSPGVIEVTSKGDLGVFTNVKGKDVKLVSTDGSTTVGSETIRHQFGHNYHDQLIRTRIEAEENLLIQGKTDVVMKAIETHSGVQTNIIAQTGMVLDQSLATIDHTVSYSYDKKSSTTTKVTNVHQNVSSHSSNGKVNIKANTGILQYGVKNSNANLDAPIILQEDVHDQRMVESQTISLGSGGGWGRFIGAKERKETNFSESISRSKGCHNSGDSFIAMAKERFKAVNPTFSAKHNEITADEIELKVGTNTHQSQTQSSYQGPIWNKVSQSTENHITHRNPTFEHNIYLHSPKVILERVRGSTGTFDKIISDSKLITHDVDDIHQSTHKSQKSLSAGASLILSLAVSLATANPFTASSLSAAMLSAGYGTLCSQAAICLVEKDGNPQKAMDELGRRDIGKTMFKSMATAGLTKGVGQLVGVNNGLGFDNLAKKYLVESAVNTVMAVSIDGQNFEKAMNQGITSAAVNTLTAYVAGKIGDARSQNKGVDRISSTTHKGLHEILGALGGGAHSVLAGGKFKDGLLPGAIGGMGETFAELTGSKQLGDLCATTLALVLNQDPTIAYKTSSIATEHNFSGVHDFVEAHQANLVWDEEDVKDGAEVVSKCVNETLDTVKDGVNKQWDYLATLEKRQGRTNYSGPGCLDGMEYALGSETAKSGTNIIIDSFKVPENQHLAGLHLMSLIPGAGKVIGMGVNEVARGVTNYTSKKAIEKLAVKDFSSSIIKFKNPGTASNSNFMQAINRNVMPVEKTGTYGTYGLVNQGKQPTLNSLAKNYGGSESNAFFKPMMSKDTLNNQIGGSQLGSVSEHQTFNQIGSKEVSQSFNKNKDLVSQKKTQKQIDFRPEHPLTEYQLKSTDTPQNRATFERYLAERRANLTREEVLSVKDQKLWERMDWLYRENAQVNPKSTSGAYRHEKLTGELVGGVPHNQKTQDGISFLERWIENTPGASSHDRSIAEQVLKDLQNAEFFK